MITLKNDKITMSIDEMQGADITFLGFCNASEPVNILEERGLQTWIKREGRESLSSGVFGNFLDDFRNSQFNIINKTQNSLEVSHEANGLKFVKNIMLSNYQIDITAHFTALPDSDLPALQLECLNRLAGGNVESRGDTASALTKDGNTVEEIIPQEQFAQRYCTVLDYLDSEIYFHNARHEYVIRMFSKYDCDKVTALTQSDFLVRGFTSPKFNLKAEQSFHHGFTIECFNGENYQQLPTSLKPVSKTSHADEAKEKFDITSLLQGPPVFEERWSHLCLQCSGNQIDNIKKVINELLLPLKYNGIIFEIDCGIKLASHPELSEQNAMRFSELLELVRFTKNAGMKVGIQFNTPGHQYETGISKVYPDFIEPTPGRGDALCVSNPGVRALVSDIMEELIDGISPDLIHLGADEVQFEGHETSFGYCDLCKGQEPWKLFGEYAEWLSNSVLNKKIKCGMWGDMFLQSSQFGAACSGNGTAGDVWKSLSLLPKETIIFDWHYYPSESFKSLDYFMEEGFDVWPVTAFNFDGIKSFLCYAESIGVKKTLHTTWAAYSQEKLPIESMVWAGLYQWLGEKANEIDVKEISLQFCRNFW